MLPPKKRLFHRPGSGLLVLLLLMLFAVKPCRAGWQPVPGVPTAEQLRAIDGYSASSILAVGNAGTILQFNGTAWQEIVGITDQTIMGVWWALENKAFAVADKGVILHFDGSGWTAMNSGTTMRLRDIWGAAPDCVYAVGETGTILRYDGNSWKKMTSPTSLTLQSVWGFSCTSVYAVGGASGTGGTGSGAILYYDGTSWTIQSSAATPRLLDVFGIDGNVYAAGETGTMLVSAGDDGTWESMSSGTMETLRGIWGLSGDNLIAVGDYGTAVHYDGTAWRAHSSGTCEDLFALWGSRQGSIYAVGRGGMVLQYEDNSTDKAACPFTAALNNQDDLRLVRAARNSRLETLAGRCLTALFYATAPEATRLIRNNPQLRRTIAGLVSQNRQLLQALARGATVRISQNSLEKIAAVLQELQARGGTRLAFTSACLRHGVERGWLLNVLDIPIE